jgi:hypothetical protein
MPQAGKGRRFAVISERKEPGRWAQHSYDFDWVGSIASAMRQQEYRDQLGLYSETYIRKLSVTRSRRSSMRIHYVGAPLMRHQCRVVA